MNGKAELSEMQGTSVSLGYTELHGSLNHQGFPDYNAYVNITKSTTNLPPVDCSIPRPLSRPAWPSFCGLQFNTRTLELRGNYAKYRGTNIIDCISPPAGHPGQLLFKRLQAISTLKLEVKKRRYFTV